MLIHPQLWGKDASMNESLLHSLSREHTTLSLQADFAKAEVPETGSIRRASGAAVTSDM